MPEGRNRAHWARAAGAALVLIPAAIPATAQMTDAQRFHEVERGRYLARAADCTACHTKLENGQPFAGGRPIETPFGSIVSANITPDTDTGIGAWTDQQFENAVRKGVRPDGARLYPAMPYTAYTKMTSQDVRAIRAYLQTIPPVNNPVVTNTLPFPFNIRAAMHVWNALFFKEGGFQPDPQKSPEWNRGAYLVEGPGHCGACHTPKNFLGADQSSEYLRGGNIQGWFAPDITGDPQSGLGRWSIDEIVTYLKTGHSPRTGATGPMAEEIVHSSSQMHEDDLRAIATYLKSLAGKETNPAPVPASDPAMMAGQAIYRDQCSACHGLDGKGVPQLFPALADSSIVRSRDPTTIIRLVLRGSRSVATDKEPTSPGMPAYGWQLDDAQVAAVLTYIRNAWTPTAAAVSSGDVKRARAEQSARTD